MDTADLLLIYQLQSMNQSLNNPNENSKNQVEDTQGLLFAALLSSALSSNGDGFGSSTG
ncbi:MAG: lytic transglycosylase domain-containing protein, partial [Desulfitobacterium sp.]|nr:lytic transglycosylase domain-containing protein [Desulfitobacterium sp.]